ncbi:hypothetical protein F5B22DRAFT_336330 [Xylaria bambusicola]|uniref:uncharacterized protein n=1 Tax=Xylaria bambusicola TaxID=326684 RepID=UPI002007D275|nr:uncharacterized protein F5B22DRAFT_336330 [Xylaria bambusicola]KAI0525378.1 hypothetical protein F5B22DRAFT_336330 [Xylaria bambusicola]
MAHFEKHPETGVTHPSQVVVIGDRLMTDMMLANMMGSWGIWIKDGVKPIQEALSNKMALADHKKPSLRKTRPPLKHLPVTLMLFALLLHQSDLLNTCSSCRN